MDRLTFISHLIDALVWPVVALIFVWTLRPHLGGLAARLERVKLPGGAEAKFFQEELIKARSDATVLLHQRSAARPRKVRDAAPTMAMDQKPKAEPPEEPKFQPEKDTFAELCDNFPEVAVMVSFQEVEKVLGSIADKMGLKPWRTAVAALRERGLIDERTQDLLERLVTLRNLAAHPRGTGIMRDESREYAELCKLMVSELKNVLERL